MEDRATLERIFAIMRRLLLVPMDGANPIPRKGTTRHECYRALYEIQELLETNGNSGKHLPQTNADRIRSMTDEELATYFDKMQGVAYINGFDNEPIRLYPNNYCAWLDWLRQEASNG